MIRVSQVGLGRWGQRLLPVASRHCEVVIAGNRSNDQTARWLADHFPDVEHSYDVDAVMSDARVEATIIATPPPTHFDLVRRAIASGKHVFVEKPLATTASEAEALVRLAAEKGKVLFVGHVYLHHPACRALFDLAESDPVRRLRTVWRKLGTFDSPVLWNLGVHEIALALAMMKSAPTSVSLVERGGLVTDLDVATVRMTFGGDREATIHLDRASGVRVKEVTLQLESGRLLSWHGDTLEELHYNGKRTTLIEAPGTALDAEMRAFTDVLRTRVTSAESDPALAAQAVGILSSLEKNIKESA